MTSDRRSYTERVNDTAKVLAQRINSRALGKRLAIDAGLATGLPDLLDERADLEADRDRYRDALAELLGGIAASPRPDQRHWVEARVYLPDLVEAREMMRGAPGCRSRHGAKLLRDLAAVHEAEAARADALAADTPGGAS